MLSTAKSDATVRDLSESLERRGLTTVTSTVEDVDGKAIGYKITINTDQMSVRIVAQSLSSRDIFGNENYIFTPNSCLFAIDDGASSTDVVKVMMDLGKYGFALKIGEGADLAAAETAADNASEQRHSTLWPTKGA